MSTTRLSKSNMATKIITALSTTPNKVTAASHRDLELATLNYSAYQILDTGYHLYGDPGGTFYGTVLLNATLSNTDYEIFGTMISLGSSYNNDNDCVFRVSNKTTTQFLLFIGEYNSSVQKIGFHWMAVHKGISDITINN